VFCGHRIFEAGRSERFFLPGDRIKVKAMTAATEPPKEDGRTLRAGLGRLGADAGEIAGDRALGDKGQTLGSGYLRLASLDLARPGRATDSTCVGGVSA
jgi:hypothetical protein